MEGTFINFAFSYVNSDKESASRDHSVFLYPLESTSYASWSLATAEIALDPQNSTRTYPGLPTPETPLNNVESEVENEMDQADGWDTIHNMYAGQQIFSDVSTL